MPNQPPAGDAELREQICKIMYGTEGDRSLAMENWIKADRQSQREALLEQVEREVIGEDEDDQFKQSHATITLNAVIASQNLLRADQRTALHQLKDPERS